MEFDVIEVTEEQLKKFTAVQMQLLRTAQKNKNALKVKYAQELELFQKLVYTDGMKNSSLYEGKRAELAAEFEREVGIIVEQLNYSIEQNGPFNDGSGSGGDQSVGYIVDYSLSYTERYIIVRDYYLSIPDPAERMSLYANDAVAKKYLQSYYSTLYDVLSSYSR